MEYSEFACDLQCLSDETKDLLTAFLAEVGFESFIEENDMFKAYVQTENIDKQALQETIECAKPLIGEINYTIQNIPSQNWNKEWESTFESAEISNDIIVRIPSYTPQKTYKYEILIEPKMSFGSGTHETTSLIMQTMQQYDFNNKTVADCGCGTGILGIFASILGAKSVFAFDYDSCCVENTKTNMQLNCIGNISIELGKLDLLSNKTFNVVLANINKNILIENMEYLSHSVEHKGTLLLSGFYLEDVADVQKSAEEHGLKFVESKSKNNWTLTIFTRL